MYECVTLLVEKLSPLTMSVQYCVRSFCCSLARGHTFGLQGEVILTETAVCLQYLEVQTFRYSHIQIIYFLAKQLWENTWTLAAANFQGTAAIIYFCLAALRAWARPVSWLLYLFVYLSITLSGGSHWLICNYSLIAMA